MIQELDYSKFMERYSIIMSDVGDKRSRIRYEETEEEFRLYIRDLDGFINKTVYSKDAIITHSIAVSQNQNSFDRDKEVLRWKNEVLRDAIPGIIFE